MVFSFPGALPVRETGYIANSRQYTATIAEWKLTDAANRAAGQEKGGLDPPFGQRRVLRATLRRRLSTNPADRRNDDAGRHEAGQCRVLRDQVIDAGEAASSSL